MLKITHFSLASGMHREYWFMLTPSFVIRIYIHLDLRLLSQLTGKNIFLPSICRPDDDIKHWSEFPSSTPLLVIDCLCCCCQSS
jgi:hypothetical protein